jgi:hypothetical protein
MPDWARKARSCATSKELVVDREGLVTDAVGLAAGDNAIWSDVAGDAVGIAIARGRGTVVGIAAAVPAVPAGSLRSASAGDSPIMTKRLSYR